MKPARLAAAMFASLAAPSVAQPPPTAAPPAPSFPMTRAAAQQLVEQRFAMRDANRDRFLTNDELGGSAAQVIGRLDSDHDGRVSPAEASARTLADFDRADANHDGTVTEAEAMAMMTPPPAPPAQPQRN